MMTSSSAESGMKWRVVERVGRSGWPRWVSSWIPSVGKTRRDSVGSVRECDGGTGRTDVEVNTGRGGTYHGELG